MKRTITINNIAFPNKKKAIEYTRNILHTGETNRFLNKSELAFIKDLLSFHPDHKEKTGKGINKIKIVKGLCLQDRCFEIHRIDKSTEIFSFIKCLSEKNDVFYRFSQACRQSICQDIIDCKKEYFVNNAKNGFVKCQSSGQLLGYKDAHLDHREPLTFSVLVTWFIDKENIDLTKIEYINGDFGVTFKNEDLIIKFREHHHKHAKLRVISSKLNLGKSHLARISTQKKDIQLTAV
jgi:hypothetical protein